MEQQVLGSTQENYATRFNYSPRVKGLFCMFAFGIPAIGLRSLERGPFRQTLPPFMRGHLFDLMAAPWYASLDKLVVGDNFSLNFSTAIVSPAMVEVGQGLGLLEGYFDIGDMAAFVIGAIAWAGFEGSAKALHDSGLTLPIYRLLGIQHRKFGKQQKY